MTMLIEQRGSKEEPRLTATGGGRESRGEAAMVGWEEGPLPS